jgi:CubicO group peptidase (beta-lactamase class C family)
LPVVAPEQVGLDAKILTQIDTEVQKGLAAKNMPGCVICLGRHGKIAYLKAFGKKQVATKTEPEHEMTTETVFDLASLTKPLATATSLMVLIDQKKLRIDDHVSQYFDEFKTPEKQNITVRQLMTHTAGFVPDNPSATIRTARRMRKNAFSLSNR